MPTSLFSSPWPNRMAAADKQFGTWHSLFSCDKLESYYEGKQWKTRRDYLSQNYNPYTLNLFYSTIKIKLANFLFQRPSFIGSPRPGRMDWNPDIAIRSATVKQDFLNTVIQNPNVHFVKHMKLAALDSFFRFGLIEVGYAADWRNPQKEEPLLKSWNDTNVQESNDRVIEDNEVPTNEQFYVKRIRPKRFRVAASEATDLHDIEWCGYYDYVYTSILRKTPGIEWPKDAPVGNTFSADYISSSQLDSMDSSRSPELVSMLYSGAVSKVWNIFDQVSKKRLLYLDNYWDKPLWEDFQERLPLYDLRWDLRTEGFYPIPPCSQWVSPQDEINEAREQTRSYRRRFTRKFQVSKGDMDEEEQEKFITGPDGVLITIKQGEGIRPIENPQLGASTENALILAKDDFILITGSSAEVTKSDRETATKSNIEDQRAKIRESAEQLDFSNFVCLIGAEILATAQEKMSLGMWVKASADSGQNILEDIQINGPVYQYITNQDISDGFDIDLELDVQNATPAAMAQQQQNYLTFLSVLQKFPMIALSPVLIRKTAYMYNIRDEQIIQQMQQAAVLQMAAQASQAANQQGMTLDQASTPGQTQASQMETPGTEQIDAQLANQVM